MLGKLLPVILALVGLGAGLGAGLVLRPDPPPEAAQEAPAGADAAAASGPAGAAEPGLEAFDYVDLEGQFIVPLVADGRVGAMVTLSTSLEMKAGHARLVLQRAPKLRDAFLRVMFDHANAGGFDGTFTEGGTVEDLRAALREAAQKVLGEGAHDVLITDLARHES